MTEMYTQSGDLFVPSDTHWSEGTEKKIRNYSMKNKIMSIIYLMSMIQCLFSF